MSQTAAAPTLDINQPFLTRDAVAAGITPKQLRGPRYQRLFRGVHISAAVTPTAVQRVRAMMLLFDPERAWASHLSAARLHGVPLPTHADEHVSVTDAASRCRRPGIRCHVRRRGQVVRRHGVLTSTPLQMFVELASILTLVDLVIVGDHMVRREMTTTDELIAFCKTSDLPHASAALRAARLVRADVDSPMETRLRLLMHFAGFPEPRVNLKLRTDDGEVRRRYDLSYPAIKVIIEYDGRLHIERQEQWASDLKRREESEGDRWRFVVVISPDIFKHPGETVQRIWRVLRERGLPGLPTRPSGEWKAHFPGH